MELKKTALYDIHVQHGAKIVEFAGYLMPIQYAGIKQEHRRVRRTVGLFDVSHMGEFMVTGDVAFDLVQRLTINDASALSVNQVQYSAMCYEDGGMVDDLLVYRFADHFMMVVNAANIEKDWRWVNQNAISGVDLENKSDEISLLALQGPKAEATLQKCTDLPLSDIKFYWMRQGNVDGVDMTVSRTGYTGEPGFELYIPRPYSEQIWTTLMDAGKEFDIEPIGLAARDTLRLEMKFCLYGNDIDETTNPLEAGLGWITKLDTEFIGRDALLAAKEKGLTRKLVAFELEDKAFPRHGYELLKDGVSIGSVTSGTFSPMLEKGIGLGYVDIDYAKVGTDIQVQVRGKQVPARVIKPPFYKKG